MNRFSRRGCFNLNRPLGGDALTSLLFVIWAYFQQKHLVESSLFANFAPSTDVAMA